MDLEQVKQLLGKVGGKIVIVENDKPTLVIISYESYIGTGQKQEEVFYNKISEEEIPTEELTIDDLPV